MVVIREICKGCGLCVEFCAEGVLRMSPEFNAKGFHFAELEAPAKCTGCKNCALICPDAAIEIRRVSPEETISDADESIDDGK